MAMAANKRVRSSSLALMVITVMCASCALLPLSAALPQDAQSSSTSPAVPSDAGVAGDASVPSATQQPADTAAALPAPSSATTAPKKFPQPAVGGGGEYLPGAGGGVGYLPGAEVGSALPVPTPEEIPSAASLGFGGHGFGDECCGTGGYGWFGGPGGFGPGTYGYNGPLYFGAAPAGAFGNVAATNVLVPLVVACVSAALYV